MAVANRAGAVHDKGFRRTRDTEVDADAAVYIDDIEYKKESIQTATNTLTSSFLKTLYIALGAAVTFLALPLTWLLIRSIVIPVSELTNVAEQFSHGRIDLDIPYTERSDEIGNLAKSLNRLGMSIRVAIARLKK